MIGDSELEFCFEGDSVYFDSLRRLLIRIGKSKISENQKILGRDRIKIEDSSKLIRNPHSIFLITSPDCNLRCSYCFLESCNKVKSKEMMSEKVARKAIDLILVHRTQNKYFDVNIFGGEPLLNDGILKDLFQQIRTVEKKENIKINIILVTNLTLMSHKIANLIKKYDVTIEVSIDGPRDIHDRYRVFNNHRGSFNRAMAGLDILRKYVSIHKIWVRPTITR